MDEAGLILEWNAQAETIFGWPRDEVVGRPLSALIAPAARKAGQTEGVEQFLRPGEALGQRLQLEAMRRDGGAITVEAAITSLRRGSGYVFNAFIRDITGKIAAEAKLHQAQKMEVVGQLTGGVAHDFNNLLMVISAGLDMMERQSDPARQQLLRDGMRHAVERGAGLTRQLLTFSRRQALKPQAIDLRKQIEGMRELLDRSLRGDVQITLDFAGNLWPIEADPGELELAVLNLAVNARDAMPQGGKITLRARNAAAHKESGLLADYVRLDMVDTGAGMPPEVQARVFEPFYTTKEPGKGSGLGLAQVYGFVKQSRGAVQIDSEVGTGTTVSLFLPRSSASPAEEHQHAGNSCEERPSNGSCSHVLLVEDDDEVAALLAEMLAQLGFEVTRTASASAALGALANDRAVDLVLSDIMMPGGMNGVDLAREVNRRRPRLPVLLTSGYAETTKRDAGAAGFMLLPKPYRIEALADAIREALNHHRASQDDAGPRAGQMATPQWME
jgi:PAS domain S-box-containing protein